MNALLVSAAASSYSWKPLNPKPLNPKCRTTVGISPPAKVVHSMEDGDM